MAVLNPAPRRARPFPDDLDVLAYLGQRLLDDPGRPQPRFGEDVWDLQAIAAIPAYRRIPASIRIDWTLIAQPVWRLCAKEVALASSSPSSAWSTGCPMPGEARCPPTIWCGS